ncbi:hypothetical protein N8D56_21620 [Devosia sp. A8/3-2]|nr:hypothetical protein N8D56_21620 [Devosia sp. A8/3-2]
MSQAPADFAILGTTPKARLIAGLLAGTHGKSVVFVGESQSGFRLPRDIDLSIAPLTRPDSWALLRAAQPMVQKLIARIGGRTSWSRLDPVLFADSVEGQQALAHIRHMAQGFGLAVEKLRPNAPAKGREAVVFRDATMIHRAVAEPALDRWMIQQGVRVLDPRSDIAVHADGSGEIGIGETGIPVAQCVLADDAAILRHLPAENWPALLLRRHGTTILTEPTGRIVAPVMLEIDSGLTLLQRPKGGIAAFGPGPMDNVLGEVSALLGGRVHRAGQSQYDSVATSDGSPRCGPDRGQWPRCAGRLRADGHFLCPGPRAG